MNTLLKKNSFEPSQITTGSYLQTVNSYNVSESNACSFDYLGYLMQTHCPQNNVTKMMTAIDYLTVVFPVTSVEALKEIKGWLGAWLYSIGISISTKKPTTTTPDMAIRSLPHRQLRKSQRTIRPAK